MDYATFTISLTAAQPPAGLSPALEALWFCKNERWEESHNIAQDIPSRLGSRIHGLLHLIEGDIGNAGYWYARANLPALRSKAEIPAEWERCVQAALVAT